MPANDYPCLYQINARAWINLLSRKLGRAATLDDVPETDLLEIARLGFDWVYLLGAWQTGGAGKAIARQLPHLRQEYKAALDSLTEGDICGSCFAITAYHVNPTLGGEPALARLRQRLSRYKIRLMLDFVPNHTAIDHPWATQHPDFYVLGTEAQVAQQPASYIYLRENSDKKPFAHGRDPYFPAWTDTLQLNYANPAVVKAMRAELKRAAALCDGLRCDMAMLVLPEVFQRTWGVAALPFWPPAVADVRQSRPDFIFLAEVYWGLERKLQQQGFDYTYDKQLYDRLRSLDANSVREYLHAEPGFQDHLARFLENHDEQRAAAVFPPAIHRAAAVITFLSPGLRFFLQGQLEGHKKRLPIQLCRLPDEPVNPELKDFYARLMACLQMASVRQGEWQMLEPLPAWEGNWTWQEFISCIWRGPSGELLLTAINYSPHQSQCYLRLPWEALRGRTWHLKDQLSAAIYERAGEDLVDRGLYLDVPGWTAHVLTIE